MKTIPLETGEKVHNLRMTTNQLIEFQREYNEDMPEMEQVRLTIYRLLKWENKELTPEAAGEIMDKVIEYKGFEYLTEQAEKAQKTFFGEELYRKFAGQAKK